MKTHFLLLLFVTFFFQVSFAQLIPRDSLDSKKRYDGITASLPEAEEVYCLSIYTDWRGKDSIDEQIANFKNLNRLTVSNKNYKKIPDGITKLKYLQELGILESYDLDMQALFTQLKSLKNLKMLDVSRFNTTAYDGRYKIDLKGVSVLKNLEYLMVDYDHLDSLPVEVCRLKKLKYLSISSTGLKDLPEAIGQLSSLESLYAGNAKEGEGNPIKQLPASFVQLKKLKVLDLHGDPLDMPPALEILKKMPALRSLDLSMIEMTEVPESIGDLASLESLSFYYCGIQKLPVSISKLKNLKELDLHGNQIEPAHQEEIKAWLPNTKINF
jgi:Leucine-rich repeat (LRR) protein